MRTLYTLSFLVMFFMSAMVSAQETDNHEISTLFSSSKPRSLGGYGAITNKFTTINDDFANMVELYGGFYINHRFLIGAAIAATTNNIPVPIEHNVHPDKVRMSYEYGQGGLMTEYVIASHRTVHVAFQMFAGAGFTLQYERYRRDYDYWDDVSYDDYEHDDDWFFVAEPGVKVEINVLKWMRFSPGVSYRITRGSNGKGLSDDKLSGGAVNLTLKFGKF
ncbi:hypothetical protein [Chryseosolibacter indicus]|uniref:Outer membrane protein beta-barrel domain-containing protein n=1 Tax=Chryseosolibacter indicus TaxID=2782351 RepID=A0ABS5VY10_9BACT|nr:hypothetical protein [Chryseosolibacter indicus]MBT1706300.1 hypothetical protein [Chryseosolibacter indicus]